MTNIDFASSYLQMSQEIMTEAESFFRRELWHLVVRRCRECVELGLKSLLRKAGIEVPHLHDVGALIRKHSDRFSEIPAERLSAISRRLREERELSFYGDEVTDSPPETLYDRKDAESALEDARFVVAWVSTNLGQ